MQSSVRTPRSFFLFAFFICVLTFLVFSPAIYNDFVNWDDPYLVIHNRAIHELSVESIKNVFVSHFTGGFHRVQPLTFVFLMFEYRVFENHPMGYHFLSVLVHTANTFLVSAFVYLLFSRLSAAAFTALLFGIHPLHVEPVVWVGSQPTLFFSLFYLLALVCYVAGLRNPQRARVYYGLTIIGYILSLLCKTEGVAFPLVLILIDILWQKRVSLRMFLTKIPFFVLSAGFGVLTIVAMRGSSLNPSPFLTSQMYSIWERINLSSLALVKYIEKILFPFGLTVTDPIGYYDKGPLWLVTGFVLLSFLFIFTLKSSEATRRIHFGVVFFVLTIGLLLHVYGNADSIISHRYAYIPSIGIFIVLFYLAELAVKKYTGSRRAQNGLLACLIVYLGICAFVSGQRIAAWKNSESLWLDLIRRYPQMAIAHHNLGAHYLERGLIPQALEHLYKTIDLNSGFVMAHYNVGNAYLAMGKPQDAIKVYHQVIEMAPDYLNVYIALGYAYYVDNLKKQAKEYLQKAIDLKTPRWEAGFYLGEVYFKEGHYKEALKVYRDTLTVHPSITLLQERILQVENILKTQ